MPTDLAQYDEETREHIKQVQDRMAAAIQNLHERRRVHDQSKLQDPERQGYHALSVELKHSDTAYWSPEYKAAEAKYRDHPATQHHYAHNDHHPEHWAFVEVGEQITEPSRFRAEDVTSGAAIGRMSLVSLLEMLCDWDAATKRMKGGDLRQSLQVNAARFGISEQLLHILTNTAEELDMLDP